MRNGRLLTLLLWLAIPGILGPGCASDTSSARRRDQQEEYLRDAAKAFWHAVRWGYEDRALVFVASAEDKALLSESLRDGAKIRSIPEFELLSIVLDEPLLTGTVRVEVQLIGNTDPVLRRKRVVQSWKLVQGRWYLTVDDALLGLYQVP